MAGTLRRLYRECRTAHYASNLEVEYRHSVPTASGEPIRLCWGASGSNFGDALSPLIVHLLSGRPLIGRNLQPYNGKPRLLALGTILERAHDGDTIWGSGCRNGELAAHTLDVRAVRGPLTRDYLLERGIDCPECYGDPAMLMPWLYRPEVEPRYDVGIIRHYNDLSRPLASADLSFREIDVTADPLRVVDEICACRTIVSSSLHGLILAEAYGIPACWLHPEAASWHYPEPEMKYHDYFLATGRQVCALTCGRSFDVTAAVEQARATPRRALKPQPLLASFPYLRKGVRTLDDLAAFRIQAVSVAVPLGDMFRRAAGKLACRLRGE